jgi:hypothetical protein
MANAVCQSSQRSSAVVLRLLLTAMASNAIKPGRGPELFDDQRDITNEDIG